MSLNHSVELINSDYKTALNELVTKGTKVDCVIMNPVVGSILKGDLASNIEELAKLLVQVTYNNTHLFCVVHEKNITDILNGMTQGGYTLRDILTIPIVPENLPAVYCTLPNRRYFENKGTVQVLHMTVGSGSKLRVTDLVNGENSAIYPANWSSWFKGTLIDAYKTMMEISTDHSDIVLDPFMFTGSIGVACIQQDRKYIGIEESGHFYRQAKLSLDIVGE